MGDKRLDNSRLACYTYKVQGLYCPTLGDAASASFSLVSLYFGLQAKSELRLAFCRDIFIYESF